MALTTDDIRLAAERLHQAEKTKNRSGSCRSVVPAGSSIRPIKTRKGDTIQADYGPHGPVSCYFA